jgi:hypothetical protein
MPLIATINTLVPLSSVQFLSLLRKCCVGKTGGRKMGGRSDVTGHAQSTCVMESYRNLSLQATLLSKSTATCSELTARGRAENWTEKVRVKFRFSWEILKKYLELMEIFAFVLYFTLILFRDEFLLHNYTINKIPCIKKQETEAKWRCLDDIDSVVSWQVFFLFLCK